MSKTHTPASNTIAVLSGSTAVTARPLMGRAAQEQCLSLS